MVILEEITKQILDSREHEKAQQMLSLAIDAGELATFYYEPLSNLFSGNDTLKKWFGLSPVDKIALPHAIAAVVPEDRDRVSQAIIDVLSPASDGNYAIEYRISALPDEIRTVEATGKVNYDNHGNPLSLNGTLRDITEQKKDEQRKDDFISMVSHELKTPLTSLNGYIQLMQRKAKATDDEGLANMLNKAAKQIASMGAMIHGFLNVSRLESGKLAIDLSTFDLFDVFKELEEDLRATSETHNIVVSTPHSVTINADREKIIQVIQNLTGNAAKYSPSGSEITLSYKVQANEIYISVQDEGMGIAEEDKEQIFERYYRVKNKNTGSISGFGIGLYLCREIIERHRGRIFVDQSEVGAKFTFVLPLN
ncbi:MAG: PAS domain S-box protein [Chitinophagaceae bacterium]|nr:MAG: PAS domain S-box protein [Chitinophagaceae bacterium]